MCNMANGKTDQLEMLSLCLTTFHANNVLMHRVTSGFLIIENKYISDCGDEGRRSLGKREKVSFPTGGEVAFSS